MMADDLAEDIRRQCMMLAAVGTLKGHCRHGIVSFANGVLMQGFFDEALLSMIDADVNWSRTAVCYFKDFCEKFSIPIGNEETAAWYVLQHYMSLIAQDSSDPSTELGNLTCDVGYPFLERLQGNCKDHYGTQEIFFLAMQYDYLDQQNPDESSEVERQIQNLNLLRSQMRRAAVEWNRRYSDRWKTHAGTR